MLKPDFLYIIGWTTIAVITFWLIGGMGYGLYWLFKKNDWPNENHLEFTIHFSKSDRTETWLGSDKTLLRMAQRVGVDLRFDCNRGACNRCIAQITEGRVLCLVKDLKTLKKGYVRTCVSFPETDLEIKA